MKLKYDPKEKEKEKQLRHSNVGKKKYELEKSETKSNDKLISALLIEINQSSPCVCISNLIIT